MKRAQVRGKQAWRRQLPRAVGWGWGAASPYLQLAGPRGQGRVDTAGRKGFVPASLITFAQELRGRGRPRGTGLALTGGRGGPSEAERGGLASGPGARGRSDEGRMAWKEAAQALGTCGPGDFPVRMFVAEHQPSCPEAKALPAGSPQMVTP